MCGNQCECARAHAGGRAHAGARAYAGARAHAGRENSSKGCVGSGSISVQWILIVKEKSTTNKGILKYDSGVMKEVVKLTENKASYTHVSCLWRRAIYHNQFHC